MVLSPRVQLDEELQITSRAADRVNEGPVTVEYARPVDSRAARAVDQLGLAASSIERLPFDLSALDSGGVFINVDASNFGLLDRRLDWQALGITLPRGADLAFHPPLPALPAR